MLVNTNREYLKTLAQQEDLNWDCDPNLDLAASLRANKVSDVEHECAEEEEEDLDELVVKWFYD